MMSHAENYIIYTYLLYKLECFIGISTTEKNRITTREKLR